MFPFAVDHVTLRPVSGLPFASFGVAVSCAVPPMTMLAVGGETSTVATGTGVTVIEAVPLFPSLVAVMMTGPPTTLPVTRPLASTVAMFASLLVQVTVRPVSGLPLASLGVAVSCRVVPATMLPVAGETATDATGMAMTVIADVALCPSLEAVIVIGPPTATPVTRPVALTVATPGLLVPQVMVRPVSTLPLASFVVAVSWAVSPG